MKSVFEELRFRDRLVWIALRTGKQKKKKNTKRKEKEEREGKTPGSKTNRD